MVISVRIFTPDRLVCSTTTDAVILPVTDGDIIGVLEDHMSTTTLIDYGLLKVKADDKWTPFIAGPGIAEIDRNQVTVLITSIEELVYANREDVVRKVEEAMLRVKEVEGKGDHKAVTDALDNLKLANRRLEGINLLS